MQTLFGSGSGITGWIVIAAVCVLAVAFWFEGRRRGSSLTYYAGAIGVGLGILWIVGRLLA